jgi:hypothetical protein
MPLTIQQWAQNIAAAVNVEPGERPSVDTILLDNLDEFESLLNATKLKIPAFARALTLAGLSSTSGRPYSGNTLRTQINRARAKKRLGATKETHTQSGIATAQTAKFESTTPIKSAPPNRSVAAALRPTVASAADSIFEKLDRLKPRRPDSLLQEED